MSGQSCAVMDFYLSVADVSIRQINIPTKMFGFYAI